MYDEMINSSSQPLSPSMYYKYSAAGGGGGGDVLQIYNNIIYIIMGENADFIGPTLILSRE